MGEVSAGHRDEFGVCPESRVRGAAEQGESSYG